MKTPSRAKRAATIDPSRKDRAAAREELRQTLQSYSLTIQRTMDFIDELRGGLTARSSTLATINSYALMEERRRVEARLSQLVLKHGDPKC